MPKKICFTVMGFGKKTDFSTGKTYDLDKTYQNIIKPVVERCGYVSIRADEIQDSGLIDKSMYALLVKADLVVADITTLNPNALYELGIRHAARPSHTIILKDKDGKIPFDLDHNRFLIYTHLGDDVGASEAASCQARLEKLINSIQQSTASDSPLFSYLRDITPHTLSDADYEEVIARLSETERHVFGLSEKARALMRDSDFLGAEALWFKASQLLPEENYFVQQQTLCAYKSESPSKESSLLRAHSIISKIYEENQTNDPETLGLVGAIYKRIFSIGRDVQVLQQAIAAYARGFTVAGNHYTGENYANCLDLLATTSLDPDEQAYCRFSARKIRTDIIKELTNQVLINDSDQEKKWLYATLANCHFHLGDISLGEEFEKKFLGESPAEWEKETYFSSKPNR